MVDETPICVKCGKPASGDCTAGPGKHNLQTHHPDCWRDPAHHACAVAEVERLRGLISWREVETSTLATARDEALEEAAGRAEAEEEPHPAEMPAEIIEHVLAQDTVYVAEAIVAAVRSTKKCIARGVRALKDKQP